MTPQVLEHCTKNKPNHRLTKFDQYLLKVEQLSTPHELSYGVAPNYTVLFPFCSHGYFRKPFLASGQKVSNFHSQSRAVIALGRSDYSNAMMFVSPMILFGHLWNVIGMALSFTPSPYTTYHINGDLVSWMDSC